MIQTPAHDLQETGIETPPKTTELQASPMQVSPASVAGVAGAGSGVPMKGEEPSPTPGTLRISEKALYFRMRRVFHPTNGKKRVADEIVKQWDKGGKSRKSLEQVFQSCGYNTDCWAKRIWTYRFATWIQ